MNRDSFKDTAILIVGGAGFVGSNLAHELLDHDPKRLTIVDNLISSDKANIPRDGRIQFIEGSITDENILSRLPENLDFVFHLACYHGNQSSIADPMADHENNALTSLKLFNRLCGLKKLKRVVYAAAACAVAEKTYKTPTATTEDQPVSLYHDSPYSISKLIGELYGNYFYQRLGLPVVKARFSNVYGPREILGSGRWRGTAHTVWRNVIPTFIWRALKGQSLHLDNKGNASRDFIYVKDMVEGLMACAVKGQAGEVYNLATGRETTILDLALIINELTGNSAPLELGPARDWDKSGKRFASTEKAKEKLDFVAKVNIRDGIAQTIEWTRHNAPLIRRCIDQHAAKLNQTNRSVS